LKITVNFSYLFPAEETDDNSRAFFPYPDFKGGMMEYKWSPWGEREILVDWHKSARLKSGTPNLGHNELKIIRLQTDACPKIIKENCIELDNGATSRCKYVGEVSIAEGVKHSDKISCGYSEEPIHYEVNRLQADCPRDEINCVGCEVLRGINLLNFDHPTKSHSYVSCDWDMNP
jgi:hypothetical protein